MVVLGDVDGEPASEIGFFVAGGLVVGVECVEGGLGLWGDVWVWAGWGAVALEAGGGESDGVDECEVAEVVGEDDGFGWGCGV